MSAPTSRWEVLSRENGGYNLRCLDCGFSPWSPDPPERTHCPCHYPDAKRLRKELGIDKKQLGDHVAGALEAVGIKKRPGCGCEKRQQALNRLHEKVTRWVAR